MKGSIGEKMADNEEYQLKENISERIS